MTTLEDKLREFGGLDEAVAEHKRPVRVQQHAGGRDKKAMRGAAMKYVAAIALALAVIAFLRAGVLECKVMGEAISPRCLLVGASLSWPKPGKNGEGKAKRSAAR